MNKSNIITTIKKETRSILRDKKTMLTILLFPIVIPLMIFFYSYTCEEQTKESFYTIAVNYNPNDTERTILNECYLKTVYYDDIVKMEEAYSQKKVSGYIDYNESKNVYTIYANENSTDGMRVSSYAKSYLENYNNQLAKLYLIGEDIDFDKAYNNLTYKAKNLEGDNIMLEIIFSIAFTYIIMSIIISTTNMATSATAVEKENGTLETLLTFPIKTNELILGKYLATVTLGIISSLIGLTLTILGIVTATSLFKSLETINISINPLIILISIIVCILSSVFISALAILLTSNSKTYKEAQSSSQVLGVIAILPMIISLLGIEINNFYYLIPIANYIQTLMDIFSNNINYYHIFLVIFSSIIYVVIVIIYIIKQYKSEKILFGE